jgi:4-amino-4-deoxy-L-arabinose transferase-like glycosyltransferase
MKKWFTLIFMLAVLGMAWAWTRERARPLVGFHDFDNTLWITAAENYQRYGLISTQFQQIKTPYEAPREDWDVSQHHPPGISIITYVGLELFGNSPLAAKLPPLAATAIAAACLFNLAKSIYNRQIAMLAVFFFGFTPLIIYYSGKIGHEQFLLPLMLLFLIVYRRWEQTQRRRWLLWLALMGGVGGFIGWAWFLFLGLGGLVSWYYRRRTSIQRLWPLWVGSAAGVVGVLLLSLWQQPDILQEYAEAILTRTTNRENGQVSYPGITLTGWLAVIGSRLLWLPTPVVTFFGIWGAWKVFRHHISNQKDNILLALPGIVTIIYALVFWQAAYIHDYLIYYLIAPLSVWAAVGFRAVLFAHGEKPRLAWAAILGLLLLFHLIGSWRWSRSLFQETVPEFHRWGIQAKTATRPDEIVAINLESEIGPQLRYYARRPVEYEIQPDEVLASNRPAKWGFYIYCMNKSDSVPQELLATEGSYTEYMREHVRQKKQCYLIDLRP